MFRGTHVSPARALSENWQRGITPKILMSELWILCMALDPLKLYPHMKYHFNSINQTWVIAFGQKKCDVTENWQRGITPEILMPELWILSCAWLLIRLRSIKIMKFHSISINWTWVIAFGQKKCDGTEKVWRTDIRTDRQTDRQTDRRTDGRTDRQTTEQWSLSVTSAYSRWHNKNWQLNFIYTK